MKKFYLLAVLLLCFATLTRAQTEDQVDYCKMISRDTDATSGKHTYQSPEGKIWLKSEVTAAGQTITLNFNTTDMALHEEGGLFIRFSDNKTLRVFGQHITHEWVGPQTGYEYTTVLTLNTQQLEALKTKKVSIFQIATIDVELNDDAATQLQAYANCLVGLK